MKTLLFARPGDEIHTSLQNLADEIGFDAAKITSTWKNLEYFVWIHDEEACIFEEITPPRIGEFIWNIARTQDGKPFTTYIVAGLTMTMLFMVHVQLKFTYCRNSYSHLSQAS